MQVAERAFNSLLILQPLQTAWTTAAAENLRTRFHQRSLTDYNITYHYNDDQVFQLLVSRYVL